MRRKSVDHRIEEVAGAASGDGSSPALTRRPWCDVAGSTDLCFLARAVDDALRRYQAIRDSTLFDRILAVLRAHLGPELCDRLLWEFGEHYLEARASSLALLVRSETGEGHELSRQDIVREVLVFRLLASDPVVRRLLHRPPDDPLRVLPAFQDLTELIVEFLDRERVFGAPDRSLLDLLTEPFRASPGSVVGQLEFIRQQWEAWA